MQISKRTTKYRSGFSLLEIITVVMLSSILIIATLGIYNKVREVSETINKNIDKTILPREVLQLIAEDMDMLAAPGFDTTVEVESKIDNGLPKSKLTIENRIYDSKNKARSFEKVIWLAHMDAATERLILYRSYSGMNIADRVLAVEGEEEKFVPVCDGLSMFQIEIPSGDRFINNWTSKDPPNAITVTISFADYVENEDGTLEIPQEDKYVRTIATDRTRKIGYVFVHEDYTITEPEEKEAEDDSESKDTSETDTGNSDSTEIEQDNKYEPANTDSTNETRDEKQE